ncbi:MAG TPA: prolipoprotein diacylglyceryl transferase family protein [Pirellulales bacterium]|nr:prolipoprotein diacylglyceryl transferase family protein [Pirellulales bacterium]
MDVLQTLFYIPRELFGLPMFGFGLLLALWAVASVALLAYLVKKQGWSRDTRGYVPVLGLIGGAILFLLPALAEPQGLPIRGYGTMVLLGVAGGIWLAAARAKRAGLDPELILSLAFWIFLAGMVGARTFYVTEYWHQQFAKPTLGETIAAVANIAQGGLVVFGAFLGASAAFVFFSLRKRLPLLATFDLIAPSMILGLALGRIGCFMNGCCFGGTCNLPWAVSFPWNSPPQVRQASEGLIALHGLQFAKGDDAKPVIEAVVPGSQAALAGLKAGETIRAIGDRPATDKASSEWRAIHSVRDAEAELLRLSTPGTQIMVQTEEGAAAATWQIAGPLPGSLPVHPAQLYSSIDALCLLLFLLAWYPYRRHDGEILAWMLVLHAISRYFLESLRSDEGAVFGTGWTISQNISLLFFLIGVGMWVYFLFIEKGRPLDFYRSERAAAA